MSDYWFSQYFEWNGWSLAARAVANAARRIVGAPRVECCPMCEGKGTLRVVVTTKVPR